MIIGCPECSTKFGIPDGALGDGGRKVRCAKCEHVWLATNNDALEVETAPPTTPVEDDTPDVEDTQPEIEAEVEVAEPETTDEPEQVAVEESLDQGPEDETQDEQASEDLSLGEGSVEEALAVIKGSAIEEPDFPLAKGDIGEFETGGFSKKLIIGWSSLGVFLIAIFMAFFLMQDSLRSEWPPITKLYDVVGLLEEQPAPANEPEASMTQVDLSQYIRISNEASVERMADGQPALVIRGSVTNSADFDIDLPSVEVVLRNELRQDIFTWPFSFDETTLKAGKTMPFVEAVLGAPRETTEFELMLLWQD